MRSLYIYVQLVRIWVLSIYVEVAKYASGLNERKRQLEDKFNCQKAGRWCS